MVERKLYKTKLCVLYQRGRCRRQNCSFAHGDAELRRISSFSNGRRDHWGGDLRDKINKRRSPLRRYSPGRDARGRHTSHGHSPPRSLGKRRKHRERQQLDGQSDISGGVKISDETEGHVKDKQLASFDSKEVLDDQLRQVQSEIEILGDHKRKLEIYLEEKVQEADSLTSGIQELEIQLSKEKEECQRLASKIKKFVKAHNRHLQLEDELKRSQARLQKLADQLGSDASRPGANEENSNINIVSDGETIGNHARSLPNEFQNNASPSKKRSRIHLEADENFKRALANALKEDGFMTRPISSEELHRFYAHRVQSNNDKEAEAEGNGKNGCRPLVNKDGPRGEKPKGSESGLLLPPTSMAAHAVDEVVEVVEMGEKLEVAGNASGAIARDTAIEMVGLLFPPPPPPPVLQNAYSQHRGDDETLDIEGLEEEMVDVDIV